MTILYSLSSTYTQIPKNHEYRDSNGNPTLDYLANISKLNAVLARDFELALNALCALAPYKNYKIEWSITEKD